MHPAGIAAWVVSLTPDLRQSQRKTLGDLVAAAVSCGRVSLAALGRLLAGPARVKHKVKRAWRFCANPRVQVHDGMAGLIALLARRSGGLVVALDWVEVRSFHTVMAAAVFAGRSVPLLWASYPEWRLHRSQNALEEGLLILLRTLIPTAVPVTLLADRGFGRAEMARDCRRLGFHFLIRIRPDVHVRHRRYTGLLTDYPVKRGMRRVLTDAAYRADAVARVNIVICWRKGLPAGRDEPWFLFTDLPKGAVRLTELYGKRMGIEEMFRDDKSLRNGFALRLTQLTRADRLDRLLLILALAYWLLVGTGLVAARSHRPGDWCSSDAAGQCSPFTIGRVMLPRLALRPGVAWRAVLEAIADLFRKWG